MIIPTTLIGWCELLHDWEHHFIKRHGETVGCIFVQGNEVHCWREPSANGCWGTRGDITNVMGQLIAKHGHVKTSFMKSNAIGHKFVTRMGFHAAGEDSHSIYYKAERLKHERL